MIWLAVLPVVAFVVWRLLTLGALRAVGRAAEKSRGRPRRRWDE